MPLIEQLFGILMYLLPTSYNFEFYESRVSDSETRKYACWMYG